MGALAHHHRHHHHSIAAINDQTAFTMGLHWNCNLKVAESN
jgi:hypothetical protein